MKKACVGTKGSLFVSLMYALWMGGGGSKPSKKVGHFVGISLFSQKSQKSRFMGRADYAFRLNRAGLFVLRNRLTEQSGPTRSGL